MQKNYFKNRRNNLKLLLLKRLITRLNKLHYSDLPRCLELSFFCCIEFREEFKKLPWYKKVGINFHKFRRETIIKPQPNNFLAEEFFYSPKFVGGENDHMCFAWWNPIDRQVRLDYLETLYGNFLNIDF